MCSLRCFFFDMNLLYARILVPRLHTLICIANSALYVHLISTMYFPSKPNRFHQVLIMSTTGNGIHFLLFLHSLLFCFIPFFSKNGNSAHSNSMLYCCGDTGKQTREGALYPSNVHGYLFLDDHSMWFLRRVLWVFVMSSLWLRIALLRFVEIHLRHVWNQNYWVLLLSVLFQFGDRIHIL